MVVDILVDRDDNLSHLEYVLAVFKRVSLGEVSFRLCTALDELGENLLINYGWTDALASNQRAIYIPRSPNPSEMSPHLCTFTKTIKDKRLAGQSIHLYLSSALSAIPPHDLNQVFIKTADSEPVAGLAEKGDAWLGFDLFANAFLWLSLASERATWSPNETIEPYAAKLNRDLTLYKKPVVNYLFALLEVLLTQVSNQTCEALFRPRLDFTVCLTHDVDYVTKTVPFTMKRLGFYFYAALRGLGGDRSGNKARDFFNDLRLATSRCDYWQFDRIQALEECLGVRSTFYVYARQSFRGHLTHWLVHLLLDPQYDIRQDERFRPKLPQMLEEGWDIGLHGSLYSYASKMTLAREKQVLEEVTGSLALSVRHHWLWLAPASTWRFQEEVDLLADTTLGFNDCIGFRAGIAAAFPAYDWGASETRHLLEIPMVFMDSTLFDYARLGPGQALGACIKILEEVRRFGGCVSINWHQQTMAADYGWYGVYEDVLSWVMRNGGRCISVRQYLREAGVA